MPEIKQPHNFRIEPSIWAELKATAERRDERVSEVLRREVIAYIERNKETNR